MKDPVVSQPVEVRAASQWHCFAAALTQPPAAQIIHRLTLSFTPPIYTVGPRAPLPEEEGNLSCPCPIFSRVPQHLPQGGLSPPRCLPRLPAHAGKVGGRLPRSPELTASAVFRKMDWSRLTFNKQLPVAHSQEKIVSRDCKVFFYAIALKKKIRFQPYNQIVLESRDAAGDAGSEERLLASGKPTAALRNSRCQSNSWEQRRACTMHTCWGTALDHISVFHERSNRETKKFLSCPTVKHQKDFGADSTG